MSSEKSTSHYDPRALLDGPLEKMAAKFKWLANDRDEWRDAYKILSAHFGRETAKLQAKIRRLEKGK